MKYLKLLSKAHAGFVMALLDPGDSASLIPAGPDIIFNNLKQTSPSVIYASAYLLEVIIIFMVESVCDINTLGMV